MRERLGGMFVGKTFRGNVRGGRSKGMFEGKRPERMFVRERLGGMFVGKTYRGNVRGEGLGECS